MATETAANTFVPKFPERTIDSFAGLFGSLSQVDPIVFVYDLQTHMPLFQVGLSSTAAMDKDRVPFRNILTYPIEEKGSSVSLVNHLLHTRREHRAYDSIVILADHYHKLTTNMAAVIGRINPNIVIATTDDNRLVNYFGEIPTFLPISSVPSTRALDPMSFVQPDHPLRAMINTARHHAQARVRQAASVSVPELVTQEAKVVRVPDELITQEAKVVPAFAVMKKALVRSAGIAVAG